MSDIVNDYFHKYYPDDLDQEKFEYDSSLGGMERYPLGPGQSNIFPAMKCQDGFEMSVQGHYGAYSTPRDDFSDRYSAVEILAVPKADDLLAPYEKDYNLIADGKMIYPWVPVAIVIAVIEKHGGLAKAPQR